MKKTIIAILAAAAVLASCQKTGPQIYRGYYSFKTGGYVEVTGKIYETVLDTVSIDTTITEHKIGPIICRDTTYTYHTVLDTIGSRDTSFIRYLPSENGQMHILGDTGDNVKVTMNISGGNPVVFDATATTESITLQPVERQAYLLPNLETSGQSISFVLTVSGTGHKYENMVLFDLDYRGAYNIENIEGRISKSSVTCIATRNE